MTDTVPSRSKRLVRGALIAVAVSLIAAIGLVLMHEHPKSSAPPASSSATVATTPAPAQPAVINATMSYIMAHGFTKNQAAGIVANLVAESNLNPEAVYDPTQGDGGVIGRGIALWNENTGWQRLYDYALTSRPGRLLTDYDLQVDFLLHDLQATQSQTWEALRGSTTAAAAAEIFATGYLKLGGAGQLTSRLRQAELFAS